MQLALDLASPRARNTDPASSHEAAQRQCRGRANSDGMIVLACVKAMPGATSAELALFYGLNRNMVARRLPDLKERGLVFYRLGLDDKRILRKCKVNGTNAVPWWPR